VLVLAADASSSSTAQSAWQASVRWQCNFDNAVPRQAHLTAISLYCASICLAYARSPSKYNLAIVLNNHGVAAAMQDDVQQRQQQQQQQTTVHLRLGMHPPLITQVPSLQVAPGAPAGPGS
jgi:hypothetical protein